MKWLSLLLPLVSKIPFEKLLARGTPSRYDKEEAFYKKLEEEYLHGKPGGAGYTPGAVGLNPPSGSTISQEELEFYQKRELGKSLLLLQKHFEQKCKIAGKACDCCEKHPLEIEGLAQETLGITGDDLYHEIAEWSRKIAPVTTVAASASGQYDELYAKLARDARHFRKRVMGTEDISALMTPEQAEYVKKQLSEILTEGGKDERTSPRETPQDMRPGRPDMPARDSETSRGPGHAAGERKDAGNVSGSAAPGGEDKVRAATPKGDSPGRP